MRVRVVELHELRDADGLEMGVVAIARADARFRNRPQRLGVQNTWYHG